MNHYSGFLFFSLIIISLTNVSGSNSSSSSSLTISRRTLAIDNVNDEAKVSSGSLSSSSQHRGLIKATCGYPGSPRNGRVLHLLERYEEGMIVTFECDPGYYLLGPMTRTCLSNSTWSSRIPICDQSMNNLGLTSASEALNNYPPQLAVDGNFRTCFFSNRRKPRWWRVELPKSSIKNQSIISVALTLPPINAELFFSIYVIEVETLSTIGGGENGTNSELNATGTTITTTSTSSKYHKCATFRGVFSSKTIFVQCTSNNGAGGLRGNYLQIEDDYPQLEYFGLCEVDVFVERPNYECGQIEVPAFGFVLDQQITVDGLRSVEYHCHEGYRLVGEPKRRCNTRTGQWIQQEPYCERITCPEPISIHNGFYRFYGDYYDLPVVGTRTVYECRPGFVFIDVNTNDTRVCDRDGQWSGDIPQCEAIDCGHPESLIVNSEEFFLSGAQFRLINGTTKFSAMAELICSNQDIQLANLTRLTLWFRCREDGLWTEVIGINETVRTSSSCVKQRHNGFLYFYAYGSSSKNLFFRNKNFHIRETSVNILHLLAAVVIAAFLSILIIVVLLFKRNIIEWPQSEWYHCSSISAKQIFKSTGQSIVKFTIWVFVLVKSYLQQSLKCCCRQNNPSQEADNNEDQAIKKSSPKSMHKPPFTITPYSSLDFESGQISGQNSQNSQRKSGEPQSSSSSSIIEGESDINTNKKGDDLNTALATFYEEITNAAKQMFSEETDRKLLRAARIAAELDAIKNHQHHHQQQQTGSSANYQWIYSTPPRFSHATSSSLPPSLHEYHQVIPQPSRSQIYAKVDLIRKHRYRKEKEIINVYQVPKPSTRCNGTRTEIDCFLNNHNTHHSNYHKLRKAISTPDAVFVVGGDANGGESGEYGTIKRLLAIPQANSVNQTSFPKQIVQVISSNHNRSPDSSSSHHNIIHEPINKYPLKTLL